MLVLVARYDAVGGIQSLSRASVSLLASKFEVDVVDIESLRRGCPVRDRIRAAFRLLASVRRADMILAFHLGAARLGFLARRRTIVVPFIFGIDVWRALPFSKRRILQRANLVISISDYTLKRAYSYGNRPAASSVVHLGTEGSQYKGTRRPIGDRKNVLIIGRMVHGRDKGHRLLLEALSAFKLFRELGAHLYVIGDGDDAEGVRAHAQALGLRDCVTFTGLVSDEALEEYWATARLLVMPSTSEGFGLVYIEAMARGVIPIASNLDAGSEVITDGEDGYVVERTEEALQAAMARVLMDDALADRLSVNAYKSWRRKYRLVEYGRRLVDALASVQ